MMYTTATAARLFQFYHFYFFPSSSRMSWRFVGAVCSVRTLESASDLDLMGARITRIRISSFVSNQTLDIWVSQKKPRKCVI